MRTYSSHFLTFSAMSLIWIFSKDNISKCCSSNLSRSDLSLTWEFVAFSYILGTRFNSIFLRDSSSFVKKVFKGWILWPVCSPLLLHCTQIKPLCLHCDDKHTKFRDSFWCSFFLSHLGYFNLSLTEMDVLCLLYLIGFIIKRYKLHQCRAYIRIVNKSFGQFYWVSSTTIYNSAEVNSFLKRRADRVTL